MTKSTLLACTISASLLSTSFAKDTVAVYDLEGAIPENGVVKPNLMGALGNPKRPITHYDIVESLNFAIADDEVKALVLDIDDARMGLAQIQEIRRLLMRARKANKSVWLYAKQFNLATALLGSAADHFNVMPEGGNTFHGLYTESMYFKNIMDKAGVKMDVVHIGDFKSAGEQFYLTGPSEPAKKQSSLLFDSFYDQIISQIAEGRGLKVEDVKKIINKGHTNAAELKQAKLIDHTEYRTDFIKIIRAKYKKADFDRSYELPDTAPPKISGMMDLFKLMAGSGNKRDLSQPYIAIIPLEGAITDASIAPVRKEILKVTKDPKCKGMVLRVNSPGGSAFASDVLWEATDEFKKTERPFVVSMGGVAASGGYYVSAAADTIYAEKGTVTGSIGVVGMKPAIGGALEKIGITTHSMKRGNFADLHNTTRSFSEQERKLIKGSMLEVYATFKKRIMDGRAKRIKGDLDKLAGGRVYSGSDALKIGLIDKIGGLNEAIEECISKCEEDNIHTHLFPEPVNPMNLLFNQPSPDDKDDEFIRSTPASAANKLSTLLFQQDVFNILGEHKKHQIGQFLQQLESIQKNNIQLIAPAGLQIQTK